jgi:GT2 family glycosyltransferase
MIETPVVLIIFNRPKLTEAVLNALARVRPRTLLVVADGPRPDSPGDAQACEAARAVIERVDWNCEVIKNYSNVNLGCGRRPASGISWALQQVEEAIILEDDCVPHPSSFGFVRSCWRGIATMSG